MASKVKAREAELVARCIEGSGIFLIWAGRPIMMNSALERLRQMRLDDIHSELWFTALTNCRSDVEKELGEKDTKSCESCLYVVYSTHVLRMSTDQINIVLFHSDLILNKSQSFRWKVPV